ncbi:unnamed protein product [Protopolystoma xenopodis]|uniref:Uncharacterized protein n=1 Tax=Protopolystoma xenopodis TaxID=117903 RepID=A0A3S4ZSC8_9PLAT|nr:unnamed protein product [Protopolystoma xenopodis]
MSRPLASSNYSGTKAAPFRKTGFVGDSGATVTSCPVSVESTAAVTSCEGVCKSSIVTTTSTPNSCHPDAATSVSVERQAKVAETRARLALIKARLSAIPLTSTAVRLETCDRFVLRLTCSNLNGYLQPVTVYLSKTGFLI